MSFSYYRPMRRLAVATAIFAFASIAGCSCSERTLMPLPGDGSANGGGDAALDAALDAADDASQGGDGAIDDASITDGSVTIVDGTVVYPDGGSCTPLGKHCGNNTRACACEDCLDNDGDGKIDVGSDIECSSYYDDDEATFATGIAGDNRDPSCQDCFFNGKSGTSCQVPTSCITTGTPSNGCGAGNSCALTTACADACLVYVPNGCDCFGCCSIAKDGANFNVLIGSTCDSSQLTVTTLADGGTQTNYGSCTQCTPNPSCVNTCGRCELCLGKTLADLPADCFTTPDAGVVDPDAGLDGSVPTDGGTTGPTCDGVLPCGAGNTCAVGFICVFGCCLYDITF